MNEEKKNSRRKENNDKTGKLAKRHETRRLEAIERQVRRVQLFEEQLTKAKDKDKAQEILTHAQLTLQQIRGGVPHEELKRRFTVQPAPKAVKKTK